MNNNYVDKKIEALITKVASQNYTIGQYLKYNITFTKEGLLLKGNGTKKILDCVVIINN